MFKGQNQINQVLSINIKNLFSNHYYMQRLHHGGHHKPLKIEGAAAHNSLIIREISTMYHNFVAIHPLPLILLPL